MQPETVNRGEITGELGEEMAVRKEAEEGAGGNRLIQTVALRLQLLCVNLEHKIKRSSQEIHNGVDLFRPTAVRTCAAEPIRCFAARV
jgi:hypothetical protein